MFDSFFNSIFGSLIEKSPLGAILIISLILTFLITLAYKYLTNQATLKAMKQEMDGLRKEIKVNKDDPKKLMEIQKKSMQQSLEQMKHTIKPMIITFIPLVIIFGWLRNSYTPIGKILGPLTWIWVYIIFSIVFSMILRKVMKVY